MPPQHDAAIEATLLLERAPLYVQAPEPPARRLRARDALAAFALGLAVPTAHAIATTAIG